MGASAGTADLDLSAPPPQLEYKAAGATGVLLGHDDAKGIVECLVSITGIKDDQGDIITPGAYAETLAKRKSKGVRHHDWSRMAAKTLVQEEWLPGDPRLPKELPDGSAWPKDAGALYIKGQYNLETTDGREGYSNAKFYASEGQWSIGYRGVPGHVTRRKSDGARVLAKVDLFEWSDVLHGANTQTSTLGVKAGNGAPDDGDGLGPAWLERVVGEAAVAGKSAQAAERVRRDTVESALDQERAAERRRRADADQAIGAAGGEEKAALRAAEQDRREQWTASFEATRDAERERRRSWTAAVREQKTAGVYPELDGDLGLTVEGDALTDAVGDEETAGQSGEKGTTVAVETKVRDVLPGSYEERRDALREAARQALAGPMVNGHPEWWVYVVGTWDDRIVVNRSPRDDGENQTWQIGYTIGEDGTITLGEMVRVQLVAQVVPATKSSDGPQVADATVESVADLLEDATAQLTLAVTADAAGVKGAQVTDGGSDRLSGCVERLLDALAEVGVDVDLFAPDDEVGEKTGGQVEEKTGEQGETGGMTLDFDQMQADLAALRGA
ncbi:hypothetical protein ACQSSU_20700 [Micromonospora echinospora]